MSNSINNKRSLTGSNSMARIVSITGLLVATIGFTSCAETSVDYVANNSIMDTGVKSCCSFGFECDNITGPATVQCTKPSFMMLLQPRIYPKDAYTIIEGEENNGKGVLLLNSQRIPNFCLVWDDYNIDNSTNQRHKSALICLPERHTTPAHIFNIYATALIMSVICAFITLIIYVTLPWLRDIQGKIIMSLLLSVCVGYSCLAIIQLLTQELSNTGCVVLGFMVYYWLFASFTWLHVSSFNIWRTIVLRRSRFALFKDKNTLFIVYSLFAWGLPGICLIISLMLEFVIAGDEDSIRPRIGEVMCFIHNFRDKWALFYGPLVLIILTNVYYFISVIYHLNKMHKVQENLNAQRAAMEKKSETVVTNNTLIRNTDIHKKRINTSKNKYNIYSKLFFAMGITLIFEIISALYYNDENEGKESIILENLFFIMDIVNALQGVILFVVLILLRKRVLRCIFEKLNLPFARVFPSLVNDENNIDIDYSDVEDDDVSITDDDKKQITNNGINAERRVIEEIQMM